MCWYSNGKRLPSLEGHHLTQRGTVREGGPRRDDARELGMLDLLAYHPPRWDSEELREILAGCVRQERARLYKCDEGGLL